MDRRNLWPLYAQLVEEIKDPGLRLRIDILSEKTWESRSAIQGQDWSRIPWQRTMRFRLKGNSLPDS